MGFIDKALEKAKTVKPTTEESQIHPVPKVTPVESHSLFTGMEMPVEEIQYHVTRSVPVKADWLRRQRIITEADDDVVKEAFKVLRTHIVQRTRPANQNVLMITGPLPGEGKTLTAINLAISLAQEVDKTVLLVDADLRRPMVHEYFGIPRGPGLVDYLNGSLPIHELLVHPEGFPKFVILPGGRPIGEAAELIGSPMMAELVKELKHFYPDRYVLFDVPPLLSYADSLAFAPLVDGIILVVEIGKTTREDIQSCMKMLKEFPLLGSVLNKVDKEHTSCYYCQRPSSNDSPAVQKRFRDWLGL
ncbi:MAG: hypothetical protein BZ151_05815 [Desulfobacca sp. 4484_104]|nr:MAG: hypothetical protein BZ151_05815 [Desulfobacca sp. 4484_104]RLA87558.1 MAG: exopolysaccharide biosynthesis protein [Deltaproteobacteria bacterium]